MITLQEHLERIEKQSYLTTYEIGPNAINICANNADLTDYSELNIYNAWIETSNDTLFITCVLEGWLPNMERIISKDIVPSIQYCLNRNSYTLWEDTDRENEKYAFDYSSITLDITIKSKNCRDKNIKYTNCRDKSNEYYHVTTTFEW